MSLTGASDGMAMQIDGSTILVPGASLGIGAALATLLAERGATVALVARRADRLADVLERCRHRCAASRLYVADLANTGAAQALAPKAWDDLGGLDVLVNNAGMPKRRRVQARMLERDRGVIVNVSSFGGRSAILGEAAYRAAKFALCGWSESMALDLWHTGVDVRLILPGAIDTEIWEQPGSDEPLDDGPFEPAETVAEGIVAAIEGDAFEHYLPDMLPIVGMKTSAIDDDFAGTIAFAEEKRGPAPASG